MEKEKDNRALRNAEAGLQSIKAMVARLEHTEDCEDRDACELTDEEIRAGLNLRSESPITDEERDEYHDRERAEDAIHEDPLSIEVRSGWTTPGHDFEAEEYLILLGTGGPALRIIGDLNEHQEPSSARLQYQDWFTPWEELVTVGEDNEALLRYARVFYYGG